MKLVIVKCLKSSVGYRRKSLRRLRIRSEEKICFIYLRMSGFGKLGKSSKGRRVPSFVLRVLQEDGKFNASCNFLNRCAAVL